MTTRKDWRVGKGYSYDLHSYPLFKVKEEEKQKFILTIYTEKIGQL